MMRVYMRVQFLTSNVVREGTMHHCIRDRLEKTTSSQQWHPRTCFRHSQSQLNVCSYRYSVLEVFLFEVGWPELYGSSKWSGSHARS
eukprot:scaffold4335_cov148-Skeletonema_menzelii.AAC.14